MRPKRSEFPHRSLLALLHPEFREFSHGLQDFCSAISGLKIEGFDRGRGCVAKACSHQSFPSAKAPPARRFIPLWTTLTSKTDRRLSRNSAYVAEFDRRSGSKTSLSKLSDEEAAMLDGLRLPVLRSGRRRCAARHPVQVVGAEIQRRRRERLRRRSATGRRKAAQSMSLNSVACAEKTALAKADEANALNARYRRQAVIPNERRRPWHLSSLFGPPSRSSPDVQFAGPTRGRRRVRLSRLKPMPVGRAAHRLVAPAIHGLEGPHLAHARRLHRCGHSIDDIDSGPSAPRGTCQVLSHARCDGDIIPVVGTPGIARGVD